MLWSVGFRSMTTTGRQRFTVRAGLAEAIDDDAPYDGVPDHLGRPLREWVDSVLQTNTSLEKTTVAEAVALRLRIVVPSRRSVAAYLGQIIDDDLLDVVDEMLQIMTQVGRLSSKSLLDLEFILDQGGVGLFHQLRARRAGGSDRASRPRCSQPHCR